MHALQVAAECSPKKVEFAKAELKYYSVHTPVFMVARVLPHRQKHQTA